MSLSRRSTAVVTAFALAAVPGTALASTTHSTMKSKAEAHCKALEKKEGKTKFDATYGKKNALGKCISAYNKAHKSSKKS